MKAGCPYLDHIPRLSDHMRRCNCGQAVALHALETGYIGISQAALQQQHASSYLNAGTNMTPAVSSTVAASSSLCAAVSMTPSPSRSQLMPAPAMAMAPACAQALFPGATTGRGLARLAIH